MVRLERIALQKIDAKIDEEMDKVTDHGVGLVAVAKAVKSLNLTLAHHTAWSEERFEAVDRKFEAIDLKFEAIDLKFEAIDRRFDEVDKKFEAIDRKFDEVDRRFDAIDVRFDIMDRKIDTGHSLILGELSKLSARVEQVVAFAIRDELRVREINE